MAGQEELHEYLKLAVLELEETRARLRDLKAKVREPIAIVGMACRYPGGVNSPEDLWSAIAAGRDLISGWPTDRGWDVEGSSEIGAKTNDASYVRFGGFVSDATEFDPAFFGISQPEALVMDPQQRVILECTWEVFERAGIDPSTVWGSDTGVFLGMMPPTASVHGDVAADLPASVLPFLMTAQESSLAAGRISYVFGLQGPAYTLDTACSSSSVAIHEAAKSLRLEECSLALAGGVTVMTSPLVFSAFPGRQGLAPDGRCKSFSATADGIGWAEGVGMLLLERLSDALENRHPVLAVVRGSAVNHNGASNGLAMPNGVSQQRVIRQALANARVEAARVDVVEAHGTGTMLGDLIEAGALLATYGRHRPQARPLWLGSIKSNMGHMSAAAGVGGVIKIVEAMRHGVIPPTLHVDEPAPYVDWTSGGVQLAAEARVWPQTDGSRLAGASSFSMSGTNVHVIIEEAPPAAAVTDDATGLPSDDAAPVVSWVITAKSAAALPAQAARLVAHLDQNPDFAAVDVGFSLVSSRAQFEHRAVVVGRDRDELLSGLKSLAAEGFSSAVKRGMVAAPVRTAAVFAGESALSAGIGKRLHASFPVYARTFDEVCAIFHDRWAMPLRDLIFAEEGSTASRLLNQTAYAQPARFAVEVALFRLAESWGFRPDFVLGHSAGEVTAAYLAGLWSLADACTLVAERSRLLQSSGEAAPSVAAAESISSVCERLSYQDPAIEVISGHTGKAVETDLLASPAYWVEQLTNPDSFVEALRWARDQGRINNFLEIGPGADLIGVTRQTLAVDDLAPGTITAAPLLQPGIDETISFASGLAAMYVCGTRVDWATGYPGARRVDLPTYAFQRERLWLEVAVQQPNSTNLGNAVTESARGAAVGQGLDVAQIGHGDESFAPDGDGLASPHPATRPHTGAVLLTRSEIGEVHAALTRLDGVDQAAVLLREDRPGDRRLVGYVTGTVNSAQLRAALADQLPDYMLPAAVMALAALPLTIDGELDGNSLPAPDYHDADHYGAPVNPTEEIIAGIYARVLGVERVGVDQSFFDLGGDSLLAMRMIAEVNEAFGVHLNVRILFGAPSVGSLSRQLDRHADLAEDVVPVEFLKQGDGVPLFCIHPALGISWSYRAVGEYLDRPIVGIQQVSADDEVKPESIRDMAKTYADRLQTVYPAGPYHLLGWSAGGVIAHELAIELVRRGCVVERLVLLDALMFHDVVPAAIGRSLATDPALEGQIFEYTLRYLFGINIPEQSEPLTFGQVAEIIAQQDLGEFVMTNELLEFMIQNVKRNILYLSEHIPGVYDGDLIIFSAAREMVSPAHNAYGIQNQRDTSLSQSWLPYVAGGVTEHSVDCAHHAMMDAGSLVMYGEQLASHLRCPDSGG